jgi:hypothetical protein
MSQAGIISISGGTPAVPEQFTTDSGIAVPVANNLNIFGIDSIANNDNGISTSGSGATVNIILTNRSTGTVTTANATPTTALTFALGATPGVYFFEGNVVAFDTTDTAGGAYSFVSGFRTTGAAATEISTEFKDVFEEAAMATADFSIAASANNFVLTVTGIAAKTIDWNVYLTYRFVS